MRLLRRVTWPGLDRPLEALVIAPSGLWLVERRPWSSISVSDDRVRAAGVDVTAEVQRLDEIRVRLAHDLGLAPVEAHALAVVPDELSALAWGGVVLVGHALTKEAIAAPGRRLNATQVRVLQQRVTELLRKVGIPALTTTQGPPLVAHAPERSSRPAQAEPRSTVSVPPRPRREPEHDLELTRMSEESFAEAPVAHDLEATRMSRISEGPFAEASVPQDLEATRMSEQSLTEASVPQDLEPTRRPEPARRPEPSPEPETELPDLLAGSPHVSVGPSDAPVGSPEPAAQVADADDLELTRVKRQPEQAPPTPPEPAAPVPPERPGLFPTERADPLRPEHVGEAQPTSLWPVEPPPGRLPRAAARHAEAARTTGSSRAAAPHADTGPVERPPAEPSADERSQAGHPQTERTPVRTPVAPRTAARPAPRRAAAPRPPAARRPEPRPAEPSPRAEPPAEQDVVEQQTAERPPADRSRAEPRPTRRRTDARPPAPPQEASSPDGSRAVEPQPETRPPRRPRRPNPGSSGTELANPEPSSAEPSGIERSDLERSDLGSPPAVEVAVTRSPEVPAPAPETTKTPTVTSGETEPWELSPAQAAAVSSQFSGPARVRGAFGTGRSVVAACRAVHLATSRPGIVAVVVPSTTQIDPMWQRLERVGEPEVLERILVDVPAGLARTVLAEFGTEARTSPETLAKIWAAAETQVGIKPGSTDPSVATVRDEVRLIRGRGLVDAAEYDNLRAEVPSSLRIQVWALHETYMDELRRRNLPDDHDLVRMARAALRAGMPSRITSAVVDDANDLTLDELMMIRELVGTGPDALTVLDDGMPGLLPVGTTLREAGIDVAGHVDLQHDFRLTGPLWTSLVRLLQPDPGFDLAGTAERPRLVGQLPDGEGPAYLRSQVSALRRERLVSRVTELVAGGAAPGSIAMLLIEDEPEADLVRDLIRAGLPMRGLDLDDPASIALGRARDARGVEFDHVLVPDARHRDVVPVGGVRWDQRQRRRLLGLALTRARKTVWIAGV